MQVLCCDLQEAAMAKLAASEAATQVAHQVCIQRSDISLEKCLPMRLLHVS